MTEAKSTIVIGSGAAKPVVTPRDPVAVKALSGRVKSGRIWKQKQNYRSSTQHRQGVLSHLSKTLEQRKLEKEKLLEAKEYEFELKEQVRQKKIEQKEKKLFQEKRRAENELKSSSYQEVRFKSILFRMFIILLILGRLFT